MTNLKYITRDSTPLRGMPKVYFCAHPDDVEKYLHPIANDLFRYVDCSVWYGDTDDISVLDEMRLFVIPITAKFFESCNPALKQFDFAVANRIPVLPLMQEDGLVQIFNERCGDLQYLDKSDSDVTALGYEKKLGTFLSSLFPSDDLTKKIQAAFDAYIFLSYRKKDRAYAQELMRLIHKNDFCRNIAIWYDEFLVPGENFNEVIEDAIRKSDLFVLTVTPNLVIENNYVITREYPFARTEKKMVLPAEMLPTDRAMLEELFPDLPECTDALLLSDSLLSAIRDLAIGESTNTPEHDFFIGLAYLGGIDVEVDREKGVSLIDSAAERGLPEAMQKLIDMYTWGEGVERDIEIALKWAKKLVDTRKKIYCTEKTPENADAYLYAYRYLISVMPDFKHYSCKRKLSHIAEMLAKETSDRRLLKYSYVYLPVESPRSIAQKLLRVEELAFELGDVDLFEALFDSYGELADHYEEIGDFIGALDLYLKGIGTAYAANDNLIENGGLFGVIDLLLFGLCSLARSGSVGEAEKVVQALDKIAEEHRDELCAKYYAQGERILASMLFKRGELDRSAEHAERAIRIQNELSEKHPQDGLDEKFDTLFLLNRIYSKKRDVEAADRYYREAVSVCKRMDEFAENAEACIEIARLYIRLIELADRDEAEAHCRRASDIMLKADKAPELCRLYELRELAELHLDLCHTLGVSQHIPKAINLYSEYMDRGRVRCGLEGVSACYGELARLTADEGERNLYQSMAQKYLRLSKNIVYRIYYRLKKRGKNDNHG